MAPIPRKKRSNHGTSLSGSSAAAPNLAPNESQDSLSIQRKTASSSSKRSLSVQKDRLSAGTKKREMKPWASSTTPSSADTPRDSTRKPAPSLVELVSESPLILRIKIAMDSSQRPRTTKRQHAKRRRPLYQEMELTDSDDFLTDEEAPPKKKGRLLPYSAITSSKSAKSTRKSTDDAPADGAPEVTNESLIASDNMAPPEGTLSTLWYSREIFAHVFALEKILGYKTRPVVELRQTHISSEADSGPSESQTYVLDSITALHIQQALLQDVSIAGDSHCRTEISRLVSHLCPAVQVAAAMLEELSATREGRQPKFTLSVREQHEEVLLVKWRGRSYMHCSWERSNDIQRLDSSNNSTARNKIRRYYQSQEGALGPNWKKLLRSSDSAETSAESSETEEYFPMQFLEIERILACDETEMNLDVLAKQRGKNMQLEQESLQRRDKAQQDVGSMAHDSTGAMTKDSTIHPAYEAIRKSLEESSTILDAVSLNPDDIPWDPEDNVRYIVHWKGLPYAEITWEYWRDIKRDAVALVEDYWYRQKAPAGGYQSKPHPHVRDFKKLQESPVFGLSDRPRPTIGYDEPLKDEDAFEGFKLRAYQLEGVNWLLFNWWNKRSCILADEMVCILELVLRGRIQ